VLLYLDAAKLILLPMISAALVFYHPGCFVLALRTISSAHVFHLHRPHNHLPHDRGECYLCGAPATTRDHIPPRGLFPQPRPNNLITVPACRSCNHDRSLDDEYFRDVVAAGSNDSPQSLNLLYQRIIPRLRKKPLLFWSSWSLSNGWMFTVLAESI
jgi:hypothetical protein